MKHCKSGAENRFLLLYSSQTGQAKAIAEEIADTAPNFGLCANLQCLSATEKKFSIERESCVVFVVSTTGDGEPPDTAIKFFRRINKRTLNSDHLKNINYTLLALGDSNYTKFCNFGRQLEKRLQELSATKFYDTGYGDDACGIEIAVDPWLHQLWPTLRSHLGLSVLSENNPALFSQAMQVGELVLNCMKESVAQNAIGQSYEPSTNGEVNSFITQNETEKDMDSVQHKISIYNLASAVKIMKEHAFKMPNLPEPFIAKSFSQETFLSEASVLAPEERQLISANSALVKAKLISTKRLTKHDESVKKTLALTFKFDGDKVPYRPGDSFGVICSNSFEEVDTLLKRLELQEFGNVLCKLSILESSAQKKKLPSHIPSSSTLIQILSSCVDIRSVPKKVLLRILSKYTNSEEDRLCLQFLSSHDGSTFYTEYIRKPSLSVLDILEAFRSCIPPVERLLEYLPALKPRFYSVASSPLESTDAFRVVFNVVEVKKGGGRCRDREGVCTGWLNQLSKQMQTEDPCSNSVSNLTNDLASLSLSSKIQPSLLQSFYVYKRQNQHFYLPDNPEVPIIMVGPGTGVAPFIGFLQHREFQMKKDTSTDVGETWLFYGCRYKAKDFLFKNELTRLQSCKVLSHLIVAFSRDESISTEKGQPRRVQDNIKLHAADVTKVIDSGGKIYVCGDAKHMSRDVLQAFIHAFQTIKNCSLDEATVFFQLLEKEKRYITDVWA